MTLDEILLDCLDSAKASYQRPVLIYDLRAVRSRLQALRSRITSRVQFLFSHKSFPVARLSSLAREYLAGFDIANAAELDQLGAATAGKLVSVTGPCWHIAPFATTAVAHMLWNAASPVQLRAAQRREGSLGVRLRVDHDAPARAAPRASSRFGFRSLDEVVAAGVSPRDIAAIHVHSGWGNNSVARYVASIDRIAAEIERVKPAVRFVNLGGGLQHLSWDDLDRVIEHSQRVLPSSVSILFEPGEFCVHRCGFALCRIIDAFPADDGSPALVVDASAGCHFRWSRPSFLLPQTATGTARPVTVYGATCEEHDIIGRFPMRAGMELLEPGSFVVLGGVTGYSAAWNHGFNGVEPGRVHYVE